MPIARQYRQSVRNEEARPTVRGCLSVQKRASPSAANKKISWIAIAFQTQHHSRGLAKRGDSSSVQLRSGQNSPSGAKSASGSLAGGRGVAGRKGLGNARGEVKSVITFCVLWPIVEQGSRGIGAGMMRVNRLRRFTFTAKPGESDFRGELRAVGHCLLGDRILAPNAAQRARELREIFIAPKAAFGQAKGESAPCERGVLRGWIRRAICADTICCGELIIVAALNASPSLSPAKGCGLLTSVCCKRVWRITVSLNKKRGGNDGVGVRNESSEERQGHGAKRRRQVVRGASLREGRKENVFAYGGELVGLSCDLASFFFEKR